MPIHQDIQAERYELKFIVPESLVPSIREFLRSYLEPDAFGGDDYSYPIQSIYLDSRGLHTFRASMNGDRNRYKLRVRYYDENPASPVFIEIKRKVNDVVQKQRCALSRDVLHDALAGDSSQVAPKYLADYASISRLIHQTNATPKAHVAYRREAWVSRENNSVRVTMDRDVRVEPKFNLILTTAMKQPVTVFKGEVVLELKFVSRYPQWFREMVQTFHIMQTGAAKYMGGVQLYGERHFDSAFAGMPEMAFV
jgi:hypothetical protein